MTFRDRIDSIVRKKVETAREARLVAAFAGCGEAMDNGTGVCDRFKKKDPCKGEQSFAKCDRCEWVRCVCAHHGGSDAAYRSRHSHRALAHPGAPYERKVI